VLPVYQFGQFPYTDITDKSKRKSGGNALLCGVSTREVLQIEALSDSQPGSYDPPAVACFKTKHRFAENASICGVSTREVLQIEALPDGQPGSYDAPGSNMLQNEALVGGECFDLWRINPESASNRNVAGLSAWLLRCVDGSMLQDEALVARGRFDLWRINPGSTSNRSIARRSAGFSHRTPRQNTCYGD